MCPEVIVISADFELTFCKLKNIMIALVTPKENLENFSSLSIEEVSKIVLESSNASCRLDPVPTWLVKSCLDVLAPSIAEMVKMISAQH